MNKTSEGEINTIQIAPGYWIGNPRKALLHHPVTEKLIYERSTYHTSDFEEIQTIRLYSYAYIRKSVGEKANLLSSTVLKKDALLKHSELRLNDALLLPFEILASLEPPRIFYLWHSDLSVYLDLGILVPASSEEVLCREYDLL